MLDNLVILVVVVIVTGVMIRITRYLEGQGEDIDPSDRVYRIHVVYRWLPVLGFAVLYFLSFIEIAFDTESSKYWEGDNLKKELVYFAIIHVSFFLIWLYLNYLKVYFDGDQLVRTTIFGTRKVPIDRIYKIVNKASSGNPGAAMTKVYARVGGKKRRIAIEVMIDGYDTLVREVEYRALQDRYVEK